MNHNNAAQPVLTDEEIQDIADGFDIYGAKPEFARAIESALLSKLRAPVADESPMAKMADALREKARQEQQAYQDRRNQATEWGPMPEGTEADRPIPIAPVAHVAGDETSRYLEWAKDRSAWEMPVGTPVYYSALASAPVAGEALGWRVRERRGRDGELLDCFVEAPAVPGMAYAQEVLGDDYAEAQGGIEGKLKHCQMIVAWANGSRQGEA